VSSLIVNEENQDLSIQSHVFSPVDGEDIQIVSDHEYEDSQTNCSPDYLFPEILFQEQVGQKQVTEFVCTKNFDSKSAHDNFQVESQGNNKDNRLQIQSTISSSQGDVYYQFQEISEPMYDSYASQWQEENGIPIEIHQELFADFFVMQDVIVSNESVQRSPNHAPEFNNKKENLTAILFKGDQLHYIQQLVVDHQERACLFVDYQVKVILQDLHDPFASLL